MRSETKLSEASVKARARRVGKREADRLIADWLVWRRFERLDLTPIHTPEPRA